MKKRANDDPAARGKPAARLAAAGALAIAGGLLLASASAMIHRSPPSFVAAGSGGPAGLGRLGLAKVRTAAYAATIPRVLRPKSVEVRWVGIAAKDLAVKIEPEEPLQTVPLGRRRQVKFRFTNLSSRPVSFFAAHTVDPEEAEPHLSKVVCFCASKQFLAPHQVKELPIVYSFDRRLPSDITDVVVTYRVVAIRRSPS